MSNPTHVDDNAFIQSFNKQIEENPALANMSAGWQQIVGELREAAVRSHRLAAMVMHDYQATKRPFALYLRTFESEAYQYVDEPGADGKPTKMWAALHGATSFEQKFAVAIGTRLPLLGIANPSDLTVRAVIPRLQLPNDGWQSAVRNLIEHAAFIVMECDALASGVIWELEAIQAAGRQNATIIVLPAKGSAGDETLREVVAIFGAVVSKRTAPSVDDPRLAAFPRILAEDDIDFDRIDDISQFRDLLASAMVAAAAAPPFDANIYATYLNNEGVQHFNNKEYSAAMGLYDQALLVRRSINDRPGLLTTLMNIGSAFIDGGQPEDSVAFLTEAHELARELEKAAETGMAAAYLGIAYKLAGNMPEAIRWLSEAVPILERASPADVKDALVHLATAYKQAGDLERARACALRLQALGAFEPRPDKIDAF
jgi:tetratricopeptide (TPR) repeat protein